MGRPKSPRLRGHFKELLIHLGWSQGRAANEFEVSDTTIRRWCAGGGSELLTRPASLKILDDAANENIDAQRVLKEIKTLMAEHKSKRLSRATTLDPPIIEKGPGPTQKTEEAPDPSQGEASAGGSEPLSPLTEAQPERTFEPWWIALDSFPVSDCQLEVKPPEDLAAALEVLRSLREWSEVSDSWFARFPSEIGLQSIQLLSEEHFFEGEIVKKKFSELRSIQRRVYERIASIELSLPELYERRREEFLQGMVGRDPWDYPDDVPAILSEQPQLDKDFYNELELRNLEWAEGYAEEYYSNYYCSDDRSPFDCEGDDE